MFPGPSDDEKPLVFVSRLTSNERAAFFSYADGFPALNARKAFNASVTHVVVDRLIMAMELYVVASNIMKCATIDAEFRNAVNRAYYSIHHSIRAMVLDHHKFEADGHELAIQELKLMLREPEIRR